MSTHEYPTTPPTGAKGIGPALAQIRAEAKAIKSPSVDHRTTDPNDLLTVDEVERILEGAKSSRDRAIIATLYETATRIAELSRLRWKDLVFDKHGCKCYIDDRKTDRRRYARLTLAHPYLAEWRANYPGDATGDAPVFVERGNVPMTYIAVRPLLVLAHINRRVLVLYLANRFGISIVYLGIPF